VHEPLTATVEELRDEVRFLRAYIEHLLEEVPLSWVDMLSHVKHFRRPDIAKVWRQRYEEVLEVALLDEAAGRKPKTPLSSLPTMWSNPGRRRPLT
jgi:hypothetical protein